VIFQALDCYDKVRLIRHHTFGVWLVGGKNREFTVLLTDAFVFEVFHDVWSHVALF
jgi:hypothetical protein